MNSVLENEIKRILTEAVTPIITKAVRDELARHEQKQTLPQRLDMKGLARETGYSKHTLYQLSCDNRIPGAHKVGGKLMFDTEAVMQWIAEGCPKERRAAR